MDGRPGDTGVLVEAMEIMFQRHVNHVVIRRQTYIRDYVETIQLLHPGVVYTGCNKVIQGFPMTVHIEGDTPPVRGPALNNKHIRPFIEMDKVEILRIYQDYGILHLLPLTRSCGLGIGDPSNKLKDRCNGCYFCLERKWAMTTLGIEDD
jgi:hypothetical protein